MLSKIDMYKDLAEIIKFHHSRYDGKGYPRTNSPDDIPFLSHVMIIADAFDAMTTNRIYKPRKSTNHALAEIMRLAGTQFHPAIVATACETLKDVEIEDTSQTPSTQLEEKRFSYFFRDALTDLHNDNYLQVILSSPQRKNNYMTQVLLRNFSQFNKHFGWSAGNKLLIQSSQSLMSLFPGALIFRCHGDNFVILDKQGHEISTADINQLEFLEKNNMSVELKNFVLEQEAYDLDTLLSK